MDARDADRDPELVGHGGDDALAAGDAVIPVFIPPLVALLWNLEQQKGAPLSEAEVLQIRDGAVCMTMSRAMARKLAESRGYDDIDPEDVWREWQAARARLVADEVDDEA